MTTTRAVDNIPFLDLVTPHNELKVELCASFVQAIEKGAFVGGVAVESFERDFAAFCDASHCVGVASGTEALLLAILASGVKPGTVIITVPNTFIATTEAISQANCLIEFVDVEESSLNMDAAKLRRYCETECYLDAVSGKLISRRFDLPVGAIIPVHLYGQPVDMDPILELAERYALPVIEDACQAHGALYYSRRDQAWKKAGSMGRAAAFSFYPGKNLGACGEGGAVITNDPEIARNIRILRDHGQSQKYFHEVEGFNGRLHAIQAGFLGIKLRYLAGWNAGRREAASRYRELLNAAGAGNLHPTEPEWAKSVYHLYVIRVHDRVGCMQRLAHAGIGTGIHYPVPLHLQKAYSALEYKAGDFPIAEAAAAEIVSLPMFPHLKREQQERVISAVTASLAAPELASYASAR